jgi:hypothetical protein
VNTPINGLSLIVEVTPVDDYDPTVVVVTSASRTRIVEIQATYNGTKILEAVWLAAEH